MFSNEERVILQNNPLADVICQLRFPEILKIDAQIPVDFQEAIREDYPMYTVRKEQLPAVPGQPQKPPINNYAFATADGKWRVNLTQNFISLSCSSYTCWEEFSRMLDKPLVSFISIYKPAHFSRIGLRYLNFISRAALDLSGTPYNELITPCYLGPLADEQVSEAGASRCSVDADISIGGGCRAKLHAGPGMVKRQGVADKDPNFVLDIDLYVATNTPLNASAATLNTLHNHAWPIFRGAITDTLFDALENK